MPWEIGDVVFLELKQDYLEQGIANTLFYRILDVVGQVITEALLDLLIQAVVDFITPSQNALLTHVEQIVDNLTDGISQHIGIYSATGGGTTTNPASSFFASGLKKSVSSRITRPGSLRLSGLTEADMNANDLSSGYAVTLQTTGTNLASTLAINDLLGTVATFKPVIVGRTITGAFDIARVNDITAMGQPRLTTQNSRKPGR